MTNIKINSKKSAKLSERIESRRQNPTHKQTKVAGGHASCDFKSFTLKIFQRDKNTAKCTTKRYNFTPDAK